MSKYTVSTFENENGEVVLPLPEELLQQLDWKEGDTLTWTDNEDGSFSLQKKDTCWVLVDTIQVHRIRYLVKTPTAHPEYALDTVTCEEAEEFSQKYLGETIASHRVVTKDEAIAHYRTDNAPYDHQTDAELRTMLFDLETKK